MDNRRPSLDLKHFNDVCPDQNGRSWWNEPSWVRTHNAYLVPLIAVFTKYDQFKNNIEIDLERDGCTNWETEAHAEVERVFQEQYLGKLEGMPHFVRLESEVSENGLTFRGWYSLRRYARRRQTLHWTSCKDCKCLEWQSCQCHALSSAKEKSGVEHKHCCNKVSVLIQSGL